MNKQIVQEAAEWFVEFNTDTPDAETRKRFDSWLRASPEHVRAFLEIVPIWEDGAQLSVVSNMTPEQLIERARAATNVVSMQAVSSLDRSPVEQTSRFTSKALRILLAASFVVALIGAALIWRYQRVSYPTYATSIGELRFLALPDHSTVEVNTNSRIRVRYSERERAVELLQGQALFHVAKDAKRPFVVYSGETRARAVGTRFDVYQKNLDTVITVVEGQVAVYSDRSTLGRAGNSGAAPLSIGDAATQEALDIPGSLLLSAGEQLTVSAEAVQQVEHPSVGDITAWTQRQLVFDFTPLKDVAQEFNRYNTRRIKVDAGQIGSLRISGIFSSTDPTSLIRFLREQPGITVTELDNEIKVSRR